MIASSRGLRTLDAQRRPDLKTEAIHDFPDHFSPMLVKELRQGLRAKIFTSVFLGMQLLLGIILLGAMVASESEHTGTMVSSTIFTFFVIFVVLIQPLRGITALSSEMRDHTIDLMTITRLTAWRIVFGKWVAIVGQSALLLVTIIPYLLLRYFFGGMNLVAEVTILGCLFAVSMALTAFTVGISGCTLVMVRLLVPVVLILGMFSTLMSMTFMISMGGGAGRFFGGSATTGETLGGVGLLLATLAYFGHQSLSMGASLIAPAAENHAITRRLVTLFAVVFFAAAGFGLFLDLEEIWQIGIPLIAVPAVVIALTESSHVAPGLVARFKKRGRAGILAAVFLIPGAASGFFFVLLLAAMVCLLILALQIHEPMLWDEYPIRMLGLWGTLLFPAVLMRFTHRGDGQRLGPFLLLLFATVLIWSVIQTFASLVDGDVMLLFVWCPVTFMLGDIEPFRDASGIVMIGIVMFVLNLLLAIPSFRTLKRLLRTPPPSPFDRS